MSTATTTRTWLPSWASLSEVERVDLYTRQSLYVLLWAFLALVLAGGAPEGQDHQLAFGLLTLGLVALGVLATRSLTAVADLYPARGPLPWGRIGPLLAGSVVALAAVLGLPEGLQGPGVAGVWVALAWGLGGLRGSRELVLLVVALTLVPLLASGLWWTAPYGLGVGLFLVFTIRASLWLLGVVTELDAARAAQASLAVAEERLRFSRDVHDVLGRHLSTIAVQSELAATLAERGDDGAPARMLDVRGLAHEALREARELARGYRSTSLDQELEGARSLLSAAGIRTDITVAGLDPSWHEPAAWVVREAVTNVLRHSSASTVTISYDDGLLEVRNDGVAETHPSEDGNGLIGLRDRLAPLGAGLEAAPEAGVFVVRARLQQVET